MLVKTCLIALVTFFAVDMLWLAVIAQRFYQNQIGSLLKTEVNWWSAILFYLIFIASLSIFVITPAIKERSIRKAVLLGALFGFTCYATYDLTNLATLKNWPLLITIVDLTWGSFISSLVSLLTYLIIDR